MAEESLGKKAIPSFYRTSASYSFSKDNRDHIRKSLGKSKRPRYVPVNGPSPSQYNVELMQTKPKTPSVSMNREMRFKCPGEFYIRKTAV